MAGDSERNEVESLRSEWRRALTAARNALRADEHFLAPEELRRESKHLSDEYAAAAEELRRLALDEGLSSELAEPFLPWRLAPSAVGLPPAVHACVFELDGVLVATTPLHVEAWRRAFDELLSSRIDASYKRHTAPFDPQIDYPAYVEGRTRLDGVRTFLASRGIRLREGASNDPPGSETVHGVANRKHEQFGLLLSQRGIHAYDGVHHYLRMARDAGIACAAVSASAHTGVVLERTGLADLFAATVDAETIAAERLPERLDGDRLLAACRKLDVDPEHAAAFETGEGGVAAAHAAGFHYVVAVHADTHPAQVRRLRHAGADRVVSTLGELLGDAS